MIIVAIYGAAIAKYGFQFEIKSFGLGDAIFIILFNIIPAYAFYDIVCYRISFDQEAIYARPLTHFGPYLELRFADVNVVDLKALTDLGNIANAKLSPAVIVLYRKGWDGDEIFALDPRRTSLRQFKDLVQMIFDRCPGTFSDDALRYLNGSDLITPRGNSEGELVWLS